MKLNHPGDHHEWKEKVGDQQDILDHLCVLGGSDAKALEDTEGVFLAVLEEDLLLDVEQLLIELVHEDLQKDSCEKNDYCLKHEFEL